MNKRLYPNPGKQLEASVDNCCFSRYPIHTPVVKPGDDLISVLSPFLKEILREGDVLFISEKCVACSQGRAIPLSEIHPRPLAVFLSRHVHRSPYGIGLSMPETMEIALRECGVFRILLASAASIIGTALGQRGWFYYVAGRGAAAIDGPCPNTLPPYNRCVVPAPKNPEDVCAQISAHFRCPVAIVDINDLGAEILGTFPKTLDRRLLARALRDNPLGQSHEQTPVGILRKLKD